VEKSSRLTITYSGESENTSQCNICDIAIGAIAYVTREKVATAGELLLEKLQNKLWGREGNKLRDCLSKSGVPESCGGPPLPKSISCDL